LSLGEAEECLVIKKIDHLDRSIAQTNADKIDNRALVDAFNLCGHLELVNLLALDNIPKLHRLTTVKKQLVNVSDWVHNSLKNGLAFKI
jgi:hypothetical protein